MVQRTSTPSRQSGFTLMEITISVVLLGILGVVGTTMMTSSFHTTHAMSNQHMAYSAARYAMERMGREIREIQYNTETGELGITAMTSSELRFVKTGLASTSTVHLQYNAGTLSLSYPPAASATLARDISALSFTYLDENRQVTNSANNVRFVRIAMTVSPADAQALPLVTQITLRNL